MKKMNSQATAPQTKSVKIFNVWLIVTYNLTPGTPAMREGYERFTEPNNPTTIDISKVQLANPTQFHEFLINMEGSESTCMNEIQEAILNS